MSIIKEKNGTFTVRWRETNPLTGEVKHKGKRGFQTKREARDFELSVGNVNHTFRTLMEDYLNSQKGYANEDTIHTKRRLYEMYCDALMSKEIAEISPKVINAWKNQVYELSLSKTTKNRLITIVKSLSKYGYTNYDLNDFAKSLKRFPKTSDDVHDMNIISPQEFQRLIDNCPNPIYRKFFIFLYHTGCRRGEAIALNKADISNGRANLSKSIRRTFSPNNRLKNAHPPSEHVPAGIRQLCRYHPSPLPPVPTSRQESCLSRHNAGVSLPPFPESAQASPQTRVRGEPGNQDAGYRPTDRDPNRHRFWLQRFSVNF